MPARTSAFEVMARRGAGGRTSLANVLAVGILALGCVEASHLVLERALSGCCLAGVVWFGVALPLYRLLPARWWRLNCVLLVTSEGHLLHDWWVGWLSSSVEEVAGMSLAYLMLPALLAIAKTHLDMMAARAGMGVRILLRPLVRWCEVVSPLPFAEPTRRPVASVAADETVTPRTVPAPFVGRAPPHVPATSNIGDATLRQS